MSLTAYAEDELRRAGLFDKDSDYDGTLGPAILNTVRAFADEDHSGFSASISISALKRLLRFKPLTPIKQPVAGDWIEVTDDLLQHCRDGELFSSDGGKAWHRLTNEDWPVWWKPWTWLRRSRRRVRFPYMPR